MKGNISLKSFIEEVKNELKSAVNEEDPFFELEDVELEVSFVLDAEAKAGGKLFVVDIGGSTKATQTHKVKLTLTPFVEQTIIDEKPTENKEKVDSLAPKLRKSLPLFAMQQPVFTNHSKPTACKKEDNRRTKPVLSGRKNKDKSES